MGVNALNIIVNVKGQNVSTQKDYKVVADSVGKLFAQFRFTDDWTEQTKTALFIGPDGTVKKKLLTSDENFYCEVPWEVIKPPSFGISVFENTVAPTLYTADIFLQEVDKSGYSEGTDSEPATADIYAQMVAAFDAAKAEAAASAQTATDKAAEVAANADTVATNTATVEADKATVEADKASVAADKDTVAGYKAAAAQSATDAAVSETNAGNSASAASASASSAQTSADQANGYNTSTSQSATSAGNSASAASASAADAGNSKSAAALSASNAAGSESAAAESASAAATSETNAAASATSASNSASAASTSASNAATSETNASNSKSAAATSATNAAASETNAASSATAAQTSADDAANSMSELTNARTSTVKSKTYANIGARLADYDTDTYLPITNAISNGNFALDSNSDGLADNFACWGSTAVSCTNSEQVLVATASDNALKYTSAPLAGHRYFVYAYICASSNRLALSVYYKQSVGYKSVLHSGDGMYHPLYEIADIDSSFNSGYFYISDLRSSGWSNFTIKNFMAIDMGADETNPYFKLSESDMFDIVKYLVYIDGTVNWLKAGYMQKKIATLNTAANEKTGYGVYSSLAVSAQATPNMTVSVPTGIIYMDTGKRFTPAANAALAVTAADATNPRIDIVYVSYDGIISYLAGTAAASPTAPSVPTGGQLLAQIAIAANATTITSANITDKRRLYLQEAWVAPTMVNSWVNYDTDNTNELMGYMKDTNGFVHFKGRIKSGTVGSTIFTLPTGYRPLRTKCFSVVSNNAYGQINIYSTGAVVCNIGNNASVFFENVIFKAEA